jgi:hypothetical protein
MQAFLTSDVIYSRRVLPGLEEPLREEQVRDEVDLSRSAFLPDIDWLRDSVVAERIAGIRGGEAAAPGLHGTALGNVTAAGQTLTPGTPVELTAADDLTFTIQVQNGGESVERDVVVRMAVSGGPKPIEQEEAIREIAAGATQTVSLPLPEPPPKDKQVQVRVTVEAVPGEEQTDNNEATFPVTFK